MPQEFTSTGKPLHLTAYRPADESAEAHTTEKVIRCSVCQVKLHRTDSRELRRCSIHWHTIPRKPRKQEAKA